MAVTNREKKLRSVKTKEYQIYNFMILTIEPKNSRKTIFVVCIVTSEDFVEKNQKLDGFLIPANTLGMKVLSLNLNTSH